MATRINKLSQEQIQNMKEDSAIFSDYIKLENNGNIVTLLNKLGKLPDSFNFRPLLYLLKDESEKIRYLALKNLAKINNIKLFEIYKKVLKEDTSTDVRREAVSAIGRLRNIQTIDTLFVLLKDSDPEVTLQAIRALIVFKKEGKVYDKLVKLKNHPNEIIGEFLKKELSNNKKTIAYGKHTQSPDYLKNTVVYCDVKDALKLIPDESIHLTFTSPPYYNARDYSIYGSYKEYIFFLDAVFKEVHRVTKEGRFFILNTSPIIIPRVSRQHASKRYPIPYDIHPYLIKMGWEFIDDIIWVKPEASVKNRNAGFLQHRKPLGYKANARTESVMVYRKKTDRLLDWNMKQYSKETIEKSKIIGKYESSNVWEIDPVFDRTHSAVFPIELCDRVIKYYSYRGDLVFDPFGGSGTLAKAAILNKRYYLLTEKNRTYIQRIKEKLNQPDLLNCSSEPNFYSFKGFEKKIEGEK